MIRMTEIAKDWTEQSIFVFCKIVYIFTSPTHILPIIALGWYLFNSCV